MTHFGSVIYFYKKRAQKVWFVTNFTVMTVLCITSHTQRHKMAAVTALFSRIPNVGVSISWTTHTHTHTRTHTNTHTHTHAHKHTHAHTHTHTHTHTHAHAHLSLIHI